MDIKANFFSKTSAAPAVSMPVIQFVADPKYREDFGMWLYENFDDLAREYKAYGRFLSLSELQDSDSPLDLT